MSLIKCHECGEEVSSKAKSCPKCGAKPKKKTSVFTWLVLIFVGSAVYVSTQTTATAPEKASKIETTPKKSKEIKYSPPEWETSYSIDEMTGESSAYASSPKTTATTPMSFPYEGVTTWMGVGCDAKSEWVYIGFSISPNLTNDDTKDGYSLVHSRIRWDEELSHVKMTQRWGEKFLHFQDDSEILERIDKSKKALVELSWHGNGSTIFKYSMKGSSKAIKEIRSACRKMK